MFTLRVFANGRVEYEGKRFVVQRGQRRTRLSPDQLTKLRDVAARIVRLDTHCCDCHDRTDAPSTYMDVADNGLIKSIRHYHGCRSAPGEADDVEDKVMSITGAGKWVGSESERRRQKWNRNSR